MSGYKKYPVVITIDITAMDEADAINHVKELMEMVQLDDAVVKVAA